MPIMQYLLKFLKGPFLRSALILCKSTHVIIPSYLNTALLKWSKADRACRLLLLCLINVLASGQIINFGPNRIAFHSKMYPVK